MRPGAALLVLTLLTGCSSREHSNPFDPANPITRGRPGGFAALAGSGLVRLRWTPPPIEGDFGYQAYRRAQNDSVFRPVGMQLPGSQSSLLDFGLTNGLRYDYRLYFTFSGVLGGLPAEDHATPGLLRPWLADLARHSLIELTPDGRQIAFESSGFYGPTGVAVDPRTGWVWLCDTYDGRVIAYDPERATRVSIAGLSEPVAVALDPIDATAWVCDQARGGVYHFTSGGAPASPAQLSPIDTPIGIALDPTGATVWVCERGANRVRRYARDGTPLGATNVTAPSRVAVDSANGDAWVTSFDGRAIVHLSPAGAVLATLADASGPIGIAVDAPGGRIWVADARGGGVIAFRRSGLVEFRVAGLPGARDVAVDLPTGEAWVTVPGLGEVVRIAPNGIVLEFLRGLSDPYGIALDPGRRGP